MMMMMMMMIKMVVVVVVVVKMVMYINACWSLFKTQLLSASNSLSENKVQ
jgi:hypothetical protein